MRTILSSSTPADPAEDIPLSLNQEFICLFDKADGKGPFGPRYHLVHGWRIRGGLDPDALRGALYDVVARHDALRTQMVRGNNGWLQVVHPPSAPKLATLDLSGVEPSRRESRTDELLNEVESGTIDADTLPHLRVVLARFDERDWLVVVMVHHLATDGWSMRLIIRDLAACYAMRRGCAVPELPAARPYREYAHWQRSTAAAAAGNGMRQYWRDKLSGAQIFTIPTDRRRSSNAEPQTAVHRFLIDADLGAEVSAFARATRNTPFMIFLAGFKLLAYRRSGATDITVPTFTPGRGDDSVGFQHMVGPCFNFLPLRTDIAGCRTFRELANRVRASCLEGYANDMPSLAIFQEAPELMLPAMADDRAPCVFQVFPFPFLLDGQMVGDLEYTEIRRRLTSQPIGSDVPDGSLWTLSPLSSGELAGSVQYRTNLYDEETVAEMAAEYSTVLRAALAAPGFPLDGI